MKLFVCCVCAYFMLRELQRHIRCCIYNIHRAQDCDFFWRRRNKITEKPHGNYTDNTHAVQCNMMTKKNKIKANPLVFIICIPERFSFLTLNLSIDGFSMWFRRCRSPPLKSYGFV